MNDIEALRAAEVERRENEEAISRVISMIREDGGVAHRIARQVGYDKFVKPLDHTIPMPLQFTFSEVTIGDRGPPKKTKNSRPSREPFQYRVTVRLSDYRDGKMTDVWKTVSGVDSPERARSRLKDLRDPTKTKTPFTDNEARFAEEMILTAEQNDMRVGWPSMDGKGRGGGTYYVKYHAVLCSTDFREVTLVTLRNGKPFTFLPAPFTDTNTDGSALKGDFFLQSRGVVKTRDVNENRTGHHHVHSLV